MDDFTKGWSQGMMGQTGGNPSQSVLEAMGRDAARNQWNNNNRQSHGGYSGSGSDSDDLIPVTTVLYQAGQKMRFKKLALSYAITISVIILGAPLAANLPSPFDWVVAPFVWASCLYLFWTVLKTPLYLIAKLGEFIGKLRGKPPEAAATADKQDAHQDKAQDKAQDNKAA